MAKPLYRLRRLLRRAQLLLLLLSAVYIMAGSILLLQRSSAPVSQGAEASLQSLSYPSRAPLSARQASGADWHHGGSGPPRPQDAETMKRSRNRILDRRLLRRHWFHSQVTQTHPPTESKPSHGPGPHQGTYMGCFADDAKTRALGGTVLYDFRKMTITLCQDTCTEGWWGLSRLRWTRVKHSEGRNLFIQQERGKGPSGTLNAMADSFSLKTTGAKACQPDSPGGFRYAGLGYGAECHCGNRITGPQARPEECSLDCKGEKGALCGGVERLSVYKLDKKRAGQRRHSSLRYQGCFKKPYNATGTFFIHNTENDSALEACVEDCTEKELPLAAVRGSSCLCISASAALTLSNGEEEGRCRSDNHTNNTGATALEYYQVYQTPALDARCKERMFIPETSTSLVALSSFPGAGNTWLRHLIELSTGFYTGSFYFDGALFNGGFKGEKDYWKKGRTICVKTHESGQREIEAFDAGILLLRNPYHSLVAEFNRKCGGHVGYATEKHWRSKDWPEFVESHASWWMSHTLGWLQFSRRLLVVHFEELRADLHSQLQLITSFLNASVSEDRLLCAESNRDGLFKRSGPRKPTFDPYTPPMRMLIDGYIVKVDQELRDRNFRGLPQEYMPR